MAILSALIKSVQFCVVTYVSVAVLYTTQYLAARSVGHIWYPSLPTHVPPAQEDISSPNLRALAVTGHAGNVATVNVDSLSRDAWVDLWSAGFVSSEVVHLPSYGTAAANHSILEETLLSKAFSQAMHPTRIIPFYYRATGDIREDDVSITTLVTSNRFKVFKQLVERYQGPISVTVHIPLPSHSSFVSLPPTHPSVVALNSLHALYSSTPLFSTYVDVHLALSPFTGPAAAGEEGEGGRQFNVWRNAARLFARTEFVMMLDVDFAVCTDWRSAIGDAIRQAKEEVNGVDIEGGKHDVGSREMVSMLREGSAALVVPAFEYVKQEDGADQRSFPTDKESLLRLTKSSPPVITSFHASWAPGHNSTDYQKYYSIPPGSGNIYKVTQYQSAYEPYVIMSKSVSWCDERFTGYGGNKAACLFEMYLSGVSFYVLADHFIIHQSHKYEEEARKEERKYNRKLYSDFKEETCLRYIHRYLRDGTLHTPRGFNVQEECKKIKNVARIAAQLVSG